MKLKNHRVTSVNIMFLAFNSHFSMKIAFRVDASLQMGTGHVMRCLTLAKALKMRGSEVLFISRPHQGHLIERIEQQGFQCVILSEAKKEFFPTDRGLPHATWLGVEQEQDAEECLPILQAFQPDWLIVDHYALDYCWERLCRRSVKNILVVDDLADRQHDCDILLDQDFYEDMGTRYIGKVPTFCKLLLGPRYILLREEFRNARKTINRDRRYVKRLLVTFGGVDVNNLTGTVLNVLSDMDKSILPQVDIVIGTQHPVREKIVSDCSKLGFSCYVQTDEIAELMSKADLAIGSSGFTSYEFIAMQLPSILIPISAIQLEVAKALERKGVAYVLTGKIENIGKEIAIALSKLMGDSAERFTMSRSCLGFMDCDGINRVVNGIIKYEDK